MKLLKTYYVILTSDDRKVSLSVDNQERILQKQKLNQQWT